MTGGISNYRDWSENKISPVYGEQKVCLYLCDQDIAKKETHPTLAQFFHF